MGTVIGILIILGLGAYIGYNVYGFIRDWQKRKRSNDKRNEK